MLYLITQFQPSDLENKDYAAQASSLNDMIIAEGARLLMNSDQLDVFVYSVEDEKESGIRHICKSFAQYSKEMARADFLYDVFTREEVEESGDFAEEFVAALRAAEGR